MEMLKVMMDKKVKMIQMVSFCFDCSKLCTISEFINDQLTAIALKSMFFISLHGSLQDKGDHLATFI